MVLESGTQNQQTRDELGSEPTISPIFKPKSEQIVLPQISIQRKTDTLGDSWIVGSSTNGLVGTNTSTQGGGQQVVGGSGRVQTVTVVTNTDNTHFEEFNNTTFKDTSNTTGDWTGSGTATVNTVQVLQSLDVYKDDANLVSATIIVTYDTGTATLTMSPDGGSNFESVTNNTLHTFTNTGSELRWKAIGDGGTAVISRVKIKYKLKG